MLTTITEAGSLKQPGPNYRPDVLSFVSAPLEQPLPICGGIRVHLRAATDGGDTAFTAKLMEVFPDGTAYNIDGGISARPEVTETIRRCVDRQFELIPFTSFSKPEIVPCRHGNDANLIGALAFHLQRTGR